MFWEGRKFSKQPNNWKSCLSAEKKTELGLSSISVWLNEIESGLCKSIQRTQDVVMIIRLLLTAVIANSVTWQ